MVVMGWGRGGDSTRPEVLTLVFGNGFQCQKRKEKKITAFAFVVERRSHSYLFSSEGVEVRMN